MRETILLLLISTLLRAEAPVFTCDFEGEPEGPYTVAQMKAAWNQPSWENGLSEERATIVAEEGNKMLRIYYPANIFGTAGGTQWEMDLKKTYDTLWVSYRIKFQEGFTFVRGGKLPGLGGGSTPTGGEATTGHDGFSARIMWRWKKTGDGDQGALCQYVYHMDKPGTYGEDLFWAYPNHGWSSTRRYFVPGTWHTVKTRIIINTPGQYDGRITSWLDEDLGLDSLLRFRAEGETGFAVDKFLFSTFFGGSDATWAPIKDEYIYFDDFILSETDPALSTASVTAKSAHTKERTIVRGERSLLVTLPLTEKDRQLAVLDLQGREITRINEKSGSFYWDHHGVAGGVYILRIDSKVLTKIQLP